MYFTIQELLYFKRVKIILNENKIVFILSSIPTAMAHMGFCRKLFFMLTFNALDNNMILG